MKEFIKINTEDLSEGDINKLMDIIDKAFKTNTSSEALKEVMISIVTELEFLLEGRKTNKALDFLGLL